MAVLKDYIVGHTYGSTNIVKIPNFFNNKSGLLYCPIWQPLDNPLPIDKAFTNLIDYTFSKKRHCSPNYGVFKILSTLFAKAKYKWASSIELNFLVCIIMKCFERAMSSSYGTTRNLWNGSQSKQPIFNDRCKFRILSCSFQNATLKSMTLFVYIH